MGDISNRTLAILIVAVLVTSLLSTWLILSNRTYKPIGDMTHDQASGTASLKIAAPGAQVGTPTGTGQASITVLPQQPAGATP
jgi:hypothetical protein